MKKDIFYTGEDNAIYTKHPLNWRLPVAAVHPYQNVYKCVAHGTIIEVEGNRYPLLLGTMITTSPDSVTEDGDYLIFHYDENDRFIDSKFSIKSIHNVYKLMYLILSGRVSDEVPYVTYMKLIKNCMETNVKLDISYDIMCMVLGTVFRNKKNPRIPAREKPDEPYTIVPLNELPVLFNLFNSLSAEFSTRSAIISLNMPASQQEDKPSILEKPFRN